MVHQIEASVCCTRDTLLVCLYEHAYGGMHTSTTYYQLDRKAIIKRKKFESRTSDAFRRICQGIELIGSSPSVELFRSRPVKVKGIDGIKYKITADNLPFSSHNDFENHIRLELMKVASIDLSDWDSHLTQIPWSATYKWD